MKLRRINVLKTDIGINSQRELLARCNRAIDLTGVRGVRFCGELKDFINLEKHLHDLKPGISFLGTGDFHHLTIYFLDKLPITPQLLLFDHHSDMIEPLPGTISCGSWVRVALLQKKIKRCIIVGLNPKDEAITDKGFYGKVAFFPENIPHEKKLSQVIKQVLDSPEPLYISIDKDVLSPGESFTNWDQGSMTLNELVDFLKIISQTKTIVGVDICGEWPAPVHEILYTAQDREKIKINQEANLKILDGLYK